MDVIKDLAEVHLSEAMLRQVDVPGLLKSFKEDYDKLDNLKKDRAKHEARHAVSRWWNSDELDVAQLNAAELHASFAKKLGQLMMISIAQSQLLNEQQQQLQRQQTSIKKQTCDIAEANEVIREQQGMLAEQQQSLENLISDYFELKGLTAEGAKQLILIAQEVKQTKEKLLMAFDEKLEAAEKLRLQSELRLQQQEIAFLQQRQLMHDEAEALKRHVASEIASQQKMASEELEAVRQQTEVVCQSLQQRYEQDINEVRQQYEQAFSVQQIKMTRLRRLAMGSLAIGIIGLAWLGWLSRALYAG
ncbi:hypothetical protein [Kalamiella sp. sgz302252]|uniref:hypothetical protein n=1 Tax=Pantoea sp. sgz302252 TaxID=3341827 RepID=UPI0036D39DE0